MTRRRVCIVGGGIAGLTAAYELSRTAAARAAFEVEIVEMSHRPGGRLASAHRPERWGRNEEHGLHVWFGFYGNTFRLAEQVWADAPKLEGCPWGSVYDGLRPIRFSDHAFRDGDSYLLRRVAHPAALAGSDRIAMAALTKAITLLERAPRTAAGLRQAVGILHPLLVRAGRWLGQPSVTPTEMTHTIDLALAIVRGLSSPEHGILEDGDLDRVSDWELTDWLRHHGAAEETLASSQILAALYDVPFAFRDGDRGQPVMEASTALRYTLRIPMGHRGAIAWLLDAGAGETMVAPLTRLLQERGVRFRYFHRLESVAIEGERLARLDFVRTARPLGDGYQPLIERKGMHALRHEPDFEQLVDGAALAARGVDPTSRFADRGEATPVALEVDTDFDDVVLALPLGCIAADAEGHTPVRAWLDAHAPARRSLETLHLVPTVAAQLWLDAPSSDYDFTDRAVITWAEPYSVVCDMSPVIAHESWGDAGPRSCAYLCGAWPLPEVHAPSSDHAAPGRARDEAVRALREQLDQHGAGLFGAAALHQPAAAAGALEAQYVRANIERWDLADLPLPGADRHRLEATDSGLSNLALAGTWVRNPVNTTSVEAAVCTGLAAARALGQAVQPILGEAFLRTPPSDLVLRPLEGSDDRLPDVDPTAVRASACPPG